MCRLRVFSGSILFQFILLSFLLTCVIPPGAWALPQIEITSPDDNGTVWGDTTVDVSYHGERGAPVIKILLYLDGSLVKEWKLPTPQVQGRQSFQWKFTLASGQTHVIGAKAVDSTGGESSATIQVRVQRAAVGGGGKGTDKIPPVIRIYYPAQGARVNGLIKVKADGDDDTGVTTVIFYVDGKLHKMIMNAPPYIDELDTARMTDGPHVLQASAFDAADNEGRSTEVTIIVENKGGGLTMATEGVGTTPPEPTGPTPAPSGSAAPPEVVIPPPSLAPAAAPPGVSSESPRLPDVVGTEMAAAGVEPPELTAGTRTALPGRAVTETPAPRPAAPTPRPAAPTPRPAAPTPRPATPTPAGPRHPTLEAAPPPAAPTPPPASRTGSGTGPALAPASARVAFAPPRVTPPPLEAPLVAPRPGQALTAISLDGYALAALPEIAPVETSPRTARPSTSLTVPVLPPPAPSAVGVGPPGLARPPVAPAFPAPSRTVTPPTLAATTPSVPAPAAPRGQAAAASAPTAMDLVLEPLALAGMTRPSPARTGTPPSETSVAMSVPVSVPTPPLAATVPAGQTAAAQISGAAEPSWDAAWGTPILTVCPSRNAQPPNETHVARAVPAAPPPTPAAPEVGAAPVASGVGTQPPAAPAAASGPAGARTGAPERTPATRVAMTPAMQPPPVAVEGGRKPAVADNVPTAIAHIRDIQVVFDGQKLDLRALPALRQGVSMGPLREIFEHTNGILYWYPQDQRVEATNSQLDLRLQIGNRQAQVNGEARTLELAPFIRRGRTMVPLQFIADTLNVTITFNPDSGQIVISSNEF